MCLLPHRLRHQHQHPAGHLESRHLRPLTGLCRQTHRLRRSQCRLNLAYWLLKSLTVQLGDYFLLVACGGELEPKPERAPPKAPTPAPIAAPTAAPTGPPIKKPTVPAATAPLPAPASMPPTIPLCADPLFPAPAPSTDVISLSERSLMQHVLEVDTVPLCPGQRHAPRGAANPPPLQVHRGTPPPPDIAPAAAQLPHRLPTLPRNEYSGSNTHSIRRRFSPRMSASSSMPGFRVSCFPYAVIAWRVSDTVTR